jgi:CheY-like chemotaxis protein
MERRRPRTPPSRPLVLMVDGHVETLALYAIALSAMGFDVIPAKDSAEGFNRAWGLHPDIIVTELALRHASGWELLERLKDEPRTRDIPVVVLTEIAQSAAHERAVRSGCAALFVKPCLPGRLGIELRKLLVPQVSSAHASASH